MPPARRARPHLRTCSRRNSRTTLPSVSSPLWPSGPRPSSRERPTWLFVTQTHESRVLPRVVSSTRTPPSQSTSALPVVSPRRSRRRKKKSLAEQRTEKACGAPVASALLKEAWKHGRGRCGGRTKGFRTQTDRRGGTGLSVSLLVSKVRSETRRESRFAGSPSRLRGIPEGGRHNCRG